MPRGLASHRAEIAPRRVSDFTRRRWSGMSRDGPPRKGGFAAVNNFSDKASFVPGVADLLRGPYLEALLIDRMEQNDAITTKFLNDGNFQQAVTSHLREKVYERIRSGAEGGTSA